MTEIEIKEAVNWYKKEGSRTNVYEHCLRSLAEEYLKIEGWPEELDETDYAGVCSPCVVAKDYRNVSFNEALRLCKLAAMKEHTGMKESSKEA